jgi:MOSC domain-containing protein YiiM
LPRHSEETASRFIKEENGMCATPVVKSYVKTVSVSRTKGVQKKNVDLAFLRAGHGIEGDAHAGPWHRQISLLAMESISKIRGKGLDVNPGDFAENITTEGIELHTLPVGTRLQLGNAIEVEVTQIGKECHNRCAIFHAVGDCVMPREGIFVRVLKGGVVRPGDAIVPIGDHARPQESALESGAAPCP